MEKMPCTMFPDLNTALAELIIITDKDGGQNYKHELLSVSLGPSVFPLVFLPSPPCHGKVCAGDTSLHLAYF